MKQRLLGTTDIKVSKICLGTMTWGYQNTEAEAHEQLDYALERDINFIDTAEVYAIPPSAETYGKTETYIGNWLADRKNRDRIVLASKMVGIGVDYIRGGAGIVAKDVKKAIDDSLKRLQTDYVDLYQLHWPQRKSPLWGKLNFADEMADSDAIEDDYFLSILRSLEEIQKEGKVRHFGLSNETAWGTMKWLTLAEKHNLPRMMSIQNAYSVIRRDFEVNLAEVAMREKVGLLAYSPLAGGFLSGKYRNGAFPEGARFSTWGNERMEAIVNERSYQAVEDLAKLAEKLGISLTTLVLSYVNDRRFVTSNIIGATTIEQLKECIDSADVKLSQETYDEIDCLFSANPNPATC